MNSKSKSNSTKSTIKVDQILSLKNINEINKKFLSALKKGNAVELTSDKLEAIDLAAIQFISQSKIMAANKGIDYQIKLNFSDSTELLIRKTGFTELFNL